MSRRIVEKIEQGTIRDALEQARSVCRRWMATRSLDVLTEWDDLLDRPWHEIRSVLLDDSERGRRLRQSSPFCRVLSPRERWSIYRDWASHEAA